MERHYYTYLIDQEFANHYFGREAVLFRLFQEFHWTKLERNQNQVINKQINYITKKIPTLYMHQQLNMNLRQVKYSQIDCIYRLSLLNGRGTASLIMKDRVIEIVADGHFEAETAFFEVMRKVNSCFLAMDFGTNRFGWLNPVKQRKFV